MKLEKVLSLFLAALCLCSILSISASAEEISPIEAPEIIAEYAIARNPISALTINQNTATCTSSVDGLDCVHISATQTLQRYSGGFGLGMMSMMQAGRKLSTWTQYGCQIVRVVYQVAHTV